MRSSVLRLCVIPLFGSVTTAATITSCSVNSGMLHESQSTTIGVGSTTCSVTPNPPPQMAAAAASVRISGNELATSVQGSVQAPVNAAGNATISASIDPAALYTDGPLRSGIVRISWFLQSSFGSDPPSTQRAEAMLGSLSTSCNTLFQSSNCNGSLTPSAGNSALPFTLGEAFTVHDRLTLNAVNDFPTNLLIESGRYGLTHTFTFFEANGTTPVPIHLTPEPSFFAPIAVVLTAWMLFRQRSC